MRYLFRFSRDPPCARSYCGDLCRRLRDLVSFEDIGEFRSIWAPMGRFEYVLTHGVAWHGTASCVIAWHGMLRHAGESSRDVWRQFERNQFVSKTYVFFMTSSQHSFTENIFRCFRSHRYFKWKFLPKVQIRIETPSRVVFIVFENHVFLYRLAFKTLTQCILKTHILLFNTRFESLNRQRASILMDAIFESADQWFVQFLLEVWTWAHVSSQIAKTKFSESPRRCSFLLFFETTSSLGRRTLRNFHACLPAPSAKTCSPFGVKI